MTFGQIVDRPDSKFIAENNYDLINQTRADVLKIERIQAQMRAKIQIKRRKEQANTFILDLGAEIQAEMKRNMTKNGIKVISSKISYHSKIRSKPLKSKKMRSSKKVETRSVDKVVVSQMCLPKSSKTIY